MLNIDIDHKLQITPQTLIGESIAVLGIKGSGKTNTAAVLIEELLPLMPMTIVDPEGEYWGLKERFEILVAGKSPNVDIAISPEQAGALARFSVENSLSLVLDISEFAEDDRSNFLLAYFTHLWDAAFIARRPYEIVLEEAHEFVPQTVRTPLKTILTRIALRGRKRGLGIISVSQRSAKVEKDILTQAGVLFLHRVRHPVDMKVYQDIIPLTPKEVERMITALGLGEAIALYDHEIAVSQIRLRNTYHVGATPELGESHAPALRQIDASLLAELRRLEAEETDTADLLSLRRGNGDLKRENEKLKLRIEILVSEAALNKKMTPITPIAARMQNARQPAIIATIPQNDGTEPSKYDLAITRERARFDVLLRDLEKRPRMDREVIIYLMERDNQTFTLRQLAREMGFVYLTLYNNQPRPAIQLGLITKEWRADKTTYKCAAWYYLEKTYPNLDTSFLYNELLTRLKGSFK